MSELMRIIRDEGLEDWFEPFSQKAGTALLLQGEVPDYVYILTAGEAVAKAIDDRGEASIFYRPSEGEVVGQLEVLGDCPLISSVFAAADCRGYRIASRRMLKLMGQNEALAMFFLRQMAGMVLKNSFRITSTVGKTSVQKTAHYLLEVADKRGFVHVDKPDIAAALFMSQRSLYRALRKLRELGVIETTRASIAITDETALRGVLE